MSDFNKCLQLDVDGKPTSVDILIEASDMGLGWFCTIHLTEKPQKVYVRRCRTKQEAMDRLHAVQAVGLVMASDVPHMRCTALRCEVKGCSRWLAEVSGYYSHSKTNEWGFGLVLCGPHCEELEPLSKEEVRARVVPGGRGRVVP